MNTQNQKITISLPNNLLQNLKDFSNDFGESKSGIIAQALEMYFDYKDLEIAQTRAKAKSKKLSLKQMREWSDGLGD